MTLANWSTPTKELPSEKYRGETDKDRIHLAVGRALNEWETLESSLALIFGHLVEARSAAAQRAYGTLTAGSLRQKALEAAATVFFEKRPDAKREDFFKLFKEYTNAAQFRANLAHGICYAIIAAGGGGYDSGWFLYPPQYNTRRRKNIYPEGASYIYKASDIEHCMMRFSQLLTEANELEAYLRTTHPLRSAA